MMPTPTGYVLAGGRSSRMGRAKASLAWRGGTLLEHVASEMAQATRHPVTVVGSEPPGFRSLPDPAGDFGPVAGIAAALRDRKSGLALIVACDMPLLTAGFLETLIGAAQTDDAGAVIPRTSDGRLHPLCAIWNADAALPAVEHALVFGMRRVHDVIAALPRCRFLDTENPDPLRNVNTPEDWAAIAGLPAAPVEMGT